MKTVNTSNKYRQIVTRSHGYLNATKGYLRRKETRAKKREHVRIVDVKRQSSVRQKSKCVDLVEKIGEQVNDTKNEMCKTYHREVMNITESRHGLRSFSGAKDELKCLTNKEKTSKDNITPKDNSMAKESQRICSSAQSASIIMKFKRKMNIKQLSKKVMCDEYFVKTEIKDSEKDKNSLDLRSTSSSNRSVLLTPKQKEDDNDIERKVSQKRFEENLKSETLGSWYVSMEHKSENVESSSSCLDNYPAQYDNDMVNSFGKVFDKSRYKLAISAEVSLGKESKFSRTNKVTDNKRNDQVPSDGQSKKSNENIDRKYVRVLNEKNEKKADAEKNSKTEKENGKKESSIIFQSKICSGKDSGLLKRNCKNSHIFLNTRNSECELENADKYSGHLRKRKSERLFFAKNQAHEFKRKLQCSSPYCDLYSCQGVCTGSTEGTQMNSRSGREENLIKQVQTSLEIKLTEDGTFMVVDKTESEKTDKNDKYLSQKLVCNEELPNNTRTPIVILKDIMREKKGAKENKTVEKDPTYELQTCQNSKSLSTRQKILRKKKGLKQIQREADKYIVTPKQRIYTRKRRREYVSLKSSLRIKKRKLAETNGSVEMSILRQYVSGSQKENGERPLNWEFEDKISKSFNCKDRRNSNQTRNKEINNSGKGVCIENSLQKKLMETKHSISDGSELQFVAPQPKDMCITSSKKDTCVKDNHLYKKRRDKISEKTETIEDSNVIASKWEVITTVENLDKGGSDTEYYMFSEGDASDNEEVVVTADNTTSTCCRQGNFEINQKDDGEGNSKISMSERRKCNKNDNGRSAKTEDCEVNASSKNSTGRKLLKASGNTVDVSNVEIEKRICGTEEFQSKKYVTNHDTGNSAILSSEMNGNIDTKQTALNSGNVKLNNPIENKTEDSNIKYKNSKVGYKTYVLKDDFKSKDQKTGSKAFDSNAKVSNIKLKTNDSEAEYKNKESKNGYRDKDSKLDKDINVECKSKDPKIELKSNDFENKFKVTNVEYKTNDSQTENKIEGSNDKYKAKGSKVECKDKDLKVECRSKDIPIECKDEGQKVENVATDSNIEYKSKVCDVECKNKDSKVEYKAKDSLIEYEASHFQDEYKIKDPKLELKANDSLVDYKTIDANIEYKTKDKSLKTIQFDNEYDTQDLKKDEHQTKDPKLSKLQSNLNDSHLEYKVFNSRDEYPQIRTIEEKGKECGTSNNYYYKGTRFSKTGFSESNKSTNIDKENYSQTADSEMISSKENTSDGKATGLQIIKHREIDDERVLKIIKNSNENDTKKIYKWAEPAFLESIENCVQTTCKTQSCKSENNENLYEGIERTNDSKVSNGIGNNQDELPKAKKKKKKIKSLKKDERKIKTKKHKGVKAKCIKERNLSTNKHMLKGSNMKVFKDENQKLITDKNEMITASNVINEKEETVHKEALNTYEHCKTSFQTLAEQKTQKKANHKKIDETKDAKANKGKGSSHKGALQTCSQCETTFETLAQLRSHRKASHPNTCGKCGQVFVDKAAKGDHYWSHFDRIFTCAQCHTRFTNQKMYQKHLASLTHAKVVACIAVKSRKKDHERKEEELLQAVASIRDFHTQEDDQPMESGQFRAFDKNIPLVADHPSDVWQHQDYHGHNTLPHIGNLINNYNNTFTWTSWMNEDNTTFDTMNVHPPNTGSSEPVSQPPVNSEVIHGDDMLNYYQSEVTHTNQNIETPSNPETLYNKHWIQEGLYMNNGNCSSVIDLSQHPYDRTFTNTLNHQSNISLGRSQNEHFDFEADLNETHEPLLHDLRTIKSFKQAMLTHENQSSENIQPLLPNCNMEATSSTSQLQFTEL